MKEYIVGGVLCVMVAQAGLAAESSRGGDLRMPAQPTRSSKFCDPICELRSQDAAFSLLVETFRQHQSYRIDTEYRERLRAATEAGREKAGFFFESDTEGLRMLRQFIYGMAKQEAQLRMAKLETQVANLQAAYSCVRKIDEDYIGEKVAKNLDSRVAQEKLRDFVILSPGTIAKVGSAETRSVPANLVLLNSPPGPANNEDVINPCD